MTPEPPVRHSLRNALLGLLVVLVLSIGLWMTLPPLPPGATPAVQPPIGGSLPVVPGIGGEFSLPSTRGGELALADLRGKVVLINFGFTQCPDVCPMVLTRLTQAMREMERQGLDTARVQPLFITFDPARDTLDVLREYLGWFHPSLIGLRGNEAQVQELARSYRVVYLKQDSGSESGYVFSHSDFIYVIDIEGRVRLLVGSKDPEMALVEAVKRLLRDAGENR